MSTPPWGGPPPGPPPAPGAGQPGFGQQGQASFGQSGPAAFGQQGQAPNGHQGGFGQPGQASFGQQGQAPFGQPGPASGGQPGQFGQPGQAAPHGQQNAYGQQSPYGQPGQASGYGAAPAAPPVGAPGSFGRPPAVQPQTQGGFGAPGQSGFGASPQAPFGAPPKKTRGAGLWIGLGAAALVVLLAVGAVVGEFVTRGGVNGDLQAKADAIALEMAESPVEGGYEVAVDGSIYLVQKLGGTFDHVTFTGVDQSVDGQAFSSTFDAYGVPADLQGPVERIEASITMPADSLLRSMGEEVEDPDGLFNVTITLGEGTITIEQVFIDLDVSFTSVYEFAANNGVFEVTLTESTLNLWGSKSTEHPNTVTEIALCDGVDGVEAEAIDASVTPDGISYAWVVTGEGATLDNLGPIGGCL